MLIVWNRIIYTLVFFLSSQYFAEAAQIYTNHKLIDVGNAALGLPIKENKEVYLQTSGLNECTGLVVTDHTNNTLLAHITSDNFEKVAENCLKGILSKADPSSKIMVRAYYGEQNGKGQADGIVEIAKNLGIKDAKSVHKSNAILIVDINGKEVSNSNVKHDNTYYMEHYNNFIDQKAKELEKSINVQYKELEDKLDKKWEILSQKLGKDSDWVMDELGDLKTKNLSSKDSEWTDYHQKLKTKNLEWAPDEYNKLNEEGEKLYKEKESEKDKIYEKAKKQNTILSYLKEKMNLVNPWSVETLK